MFGLTIGPKTFGLARQWIVDGFVTCVAEDAERQWYVEIDDGARPSVVKVVLDGSRIVVTHKARIRGNRAQIYAATAVEVLRRAGVASVSGNVVQVFLNDQEPEIPTVGLTDRTRSTLGIERCGSILNPDFEDDLAEATRYLAPEPAEAGPAPDTKEGGPAGPLVEFDFDPEADEIRAVLLEEGVAPGIVERVIHARRSDLTPEEQALVPELRPYRGNPVLLTMGLLGLLLGKALACVGMKGTGKSMYLDFLARCLNLPRLTVNGHAQTEAADLLGDRTLDVDAETGQSVVRFDVGPLVRAMEMGAMLVLDEFTNIREGIATVLNAAGDWRRAITVPGYGVVRAHPWFRLAFSGNKGYVGTFPPNEALLDRTVVLEFRPVMDVGKVAQIIAESASHCRDSKLIQSLARLHVKLMEMVMAGELRSPDSISIRGMIDAADLIAQAQGSLSPKAVLYATVANKLWEDGWDDAGKIREQIDLTFPD